jgi:hypothetical protein
MSYDHFDLILRSVDEVYIFIIHLFIGQMIIFISNLFEIVFLLKHYFNFEDYF